MEATLTGVCGDCHGRQKAEAIMHGFSDVHRDAGMDCMDCHSLEDMHGDGNNYASMLDDGAIDAKCESCHTSLASNAYHNLHSSTVDCSACHMTGSTRTIGRASQGAGAGNGPAPCLPKRLPD